MPEYRQLVEWFWNIRGFCGSYENVMTPDIVRQWQDHEYITLEKWERDCIFGMDRAFRHAYSDVILWHGKRKQIKNTSDKDKARTRQKHG